MRLYCLPFLQRVFPRFGKAKTIAPEKQTNGDSELTPGHFPVYPPPPPQVILADRRDYARKISQLRSNVPLGESQDRAIYGLYRLYELFLLDQVRAYRDELEDFWRQSEWRIDAIADPQDPDPARYAFLAGVAHLLVTSFNRKIDYGASRDAPAIMTEEYMDALIATPKDERPWESLPAWADSVSALTETLFVPTHNGELLEGLEDPRADDYFKSKNIVLWTPHIHFT